MREGGPRNSLKDDEVRCRPSGDGVHSCGRMWSIRRTAALMWSSHRVEEKSFQGLGAQRDHGVRGADEDGWCGLWLRSVTCEAAGGAAVLGPAPRTDVVVKGGARRGQTVQ